MDNFGIKALNHTSNSEIKDKCKNSDLWIILLVNVVIFGVNLLVGLINNNNNKDDNDNIIKILFSLFANWYSCLDWY